MKSHEAYLHELGVIDIELKRINEHAKSLRLQRSRILGALYRYMMNNNLERIPYGNKGLTIKQCSPKTKKKTTKPKKEKRRDGIELLREAGIPDPIQFYEAFENTQKSANTNDVNNTNNRNDDIFGSNTKKKKINAYDEQLGF